jgi:hypothetical protein
MSRRHVDRWLQYYASPVDHSQDTTILQCDPIGWHHTTDRMQRGRVMGLDVLHTLEDIIRYS